MTTLFDGRAKAVFFDLDGTLVDTAPDMVAALQDLQRSAGLPSVDYELGRSQVSNGALGLLTLAFPDETIEPDSPLLCDFIDRYRQRVCNESALFPDLGGLLLSLDQASLPWGVVTNKPEHLTFPIMATLELADRASSVICGDTLPTRKPDPAPLLRAAADTGVDPRDCVYVGDAARDIEAGRNAGMATVAVGYGYLAAGDSPHNWRADQFAENTGALVQILRKAVNLDA